MEKKTPIIAACDYGYFKIMKFLIKSGAKVDLKKNEKNYAKLSKLSGPFEYSQTFNPNGVQ